MYIFCEFRVSGDNGAYFADNGANFTDNGANFVKAFTTFSSDNIKSESQTQTTLEQDDGSYITYTEISNIINSNNSNDVLEFSCHHIIDVALIH